MFYFREYADPVGEAHEVEAVELMLEGLKKAWDEQKSKRSFWGGRVNFSKVTSFLLYSLDGVVNAVNEAVLTGPDKKATVLAALERLYDYTVREALPIWMRPLAGPVKAYIIHVLISNAIDWMVAKYKSGSWSKKDEPKVASRRARRRK
jgi:hypothetical protein